LKRFRVELDILNVIPRHENRLKIERPADSQQRAEAGIGFARFDTVKLPLSLLGDPTEVILTQAKCASSGLELFANL